VSEYWVKLAVRYYADHAVETLPDADTELMFVRGLARAGELGRAGFIPESSLPQLSRKRRYAATAETLVTAGLWTKVDGGYQVTNWDHWQDGMDTLTKRREADRARKRASRAAKREAFVRGQSADMSADVTPTEREKEQERSTNVDLRASRAPARVTASGLNGTARSVHAEKLVQEYADDCDPKPTRKVRTQLAREVDALLREQWDDQRITAALTEIGRRGLGPSLLQNVAFEMHTRSNGSRASPRSTSDERAAAAQSLKQQFAQLPPGGTT